MVFICCFFFVVVVVVVFGEGHPVGNPACLPRFMSASLCGCLQSLCASLPAPTVSFLPCLPCKEKSLPSIVFQFQYCFFILYSNRLRRAPHFWSNTLSQAWLLVFRSQIILEPDQDTPKLLVLYMDYCLASTVWPCTTRTDMHQPKPCQCDPPAPTPHRPPLKDMCRGARPRHHRSKSFK